MMLLIRDKFWPVDRELISSTPLSCSNVGHSMIWNFDSNGNYSVKFGCKALMNSVCDVESSNPGPRCTGALPLGGIRLMDLKENQWISFCCFSSLRSNKQDFVDFSVVLWYLWCKFVHARSGKDPQVVIEDASNLLYQFQLVRSLSESRPTAASISQRVTKWVKPRVGELKLNVDAVCFDKLGIITSGGIFRDQGSKLLSPVD
ncbi:hypothetical protein TorRG33x02_022640 [Trema orientale]|uniref:Uncharacterized protein n=1 Tax=Trema orientale TaxID=63057 RepID=A0A2P5FW08_TREOI|nr:hypothetical protein TorRG33x02_022640 [Trema orientale]